MSQQNRFKNTSYDRMFENFLACTDEKEVLCAEIQRRIRDCRAPSLLDIGAGNGDLAIPLSQAVARYLAIEPKPTYVSRLKDAGLEVILGIYPLPLDEHFGMVLSCHSTPWKIAEYRRFLEEAWARVSPGGVLLVVTYNDEESEWNDILRACGLRVAEVLPGDRRLPKLGTYLASLGRVTNDVVTTHVRAQVLTDILAALAFVYADGTEEREREFLHAAPRVREQLCSRYWRNGRFEFPFHHVFLQVQK